ncbi:MAG: ABC transporter permease [Acidobacteriota bacterium]
MNGLWQDLKHAVRMLLKYPAYTSIAVITLALGIGANSVMFSAVNAVLLRPLPYKTPERLVAVESFNSRSGNPSAGGVSPADFRDWQDQSRSFEQLAVYSGTAVDLPGEERTESIVGARVSVGFFPVFGVEPILGRAFAPEEELSNGPQVLILSYRLWQRRFGSDPSVVGKGVKTSQGQATVVGVMPPSFRFPSYAELWTPLPRDGREMQLRAERYFSAVGRLKEGSSLNVTRAEMETIASRLESAHPKDNQNWSVQLTPWRDYLARDSRTALLILMGAVGLMLLIACVNVANLLLVRAAARRKEIAIRLALGAGRWHLIRQLLTESLLLSLAGGAGGLLLAVWGKGMIFGLLPTSNWTFSSLIAIRDDARIDGTVLLFTLLVSTLTCLIFGLIPSWQATRPGVNECLKEGGHGAEARLHQRTRGALVVAEIALALVLLAGAGLLIRSFMRLQSVDLGYDPRGLMTMTLPLPQQNRALFARQVREEVARTPGVESASLMSFFTFGGLRFPFNIEGRPLPAGDESSRYSAISPDYFRTLKTTLRAGREFTDRDTPQTPPVAIINETLARTYFAGEDPIGKKLVVSYLGQRVPREIVAIVGDIKQDEPNQKTNPEIFVPFEQQPWFFSSLVVRSVNRDPLTVRGAVQRAIWSVSKDLPAAKAETLEQTLSDQIAAPRLYTVLLGAFSAVALILAAVGIYGVMSYVASQRTHEIGIRMALGAQPKDILKLIIRNGMFVALVGVAIGLAGAFAVTRLMAGLLFGVAATDSLTFVSVSVGLIAVALLACYIPARRATKVDPLVALRYE